MKDATKNEIKTNERRLCELAELREGASLAHTIAIDAALLYFNAQLALTWGAFYHNEAPSEPVKRSLWDDETSDEELVAEHLADCAEREAMYTEQYYEYMKEYSRLQKYASEFGEVGEYLMTLLHD